MQSLASRGADLGFHPHRIFSHYFCSARTQNTARFMDWKRWVTPHFHEGLTTAPDLAPVVRFSPQRAQSNSFPSRWRRGGRGCWRTRGRDTSSKEKAGGYLGWRPTAAHSMRRGGPPTQREQRSCHLIRMFLVSRDAAGHEMPLHIPYHLHLT